MASQRPAGAGGWEGDQRPAGAGGRDLSALVEFIARRLVDRPEAVEVRQTEDERGLIVALRVAPEDMGKVIGRQGRIARALRTVVKAAALRAGRRVTVEIGQETPPGGR